ncbi:MAG: hypothetical protein AAB340_03470 [Patescibacteria group bacterium]
MKSAETVTVKRAWLERIRGKLDDIMINITNNHCEVLFLYDKIDEIDDMIIEVLWP